MTTWAPQVSDVQNSIKRSAAGMGSVSLNDDVIVWTNEIVQEILGVAKWKFAERSTTTTTTANLRYVAVPANATLGLREIRDTTNDKRLRPKSRSGIYKSDADPDNASAGTPEYFYIEFTAGATARIYFEAPWSAAATLALDYWHSGDQITAASDLLPIPGNFYHVVRNGVLYLAMHYQGDPDWKDQMMMYKAALGEMKGRHLGVREPLRWRH